MPAVNARVAGKTLAGIALASLAAGVVLLVVWLVDPSVPGRYPPCPFRALTGLDCPGCGSLRCLHELLHGDLVAAADHNVAVLLALPYALVVAGRAMWRSRTGASRWMPPAAAAWAVAAALVGWWVARNLPAFAWFASAAS